MAKERRLRVLVGKVGLDGHDRGALIITQALRNAGMEVIYSGLKNTPEQLVSAAIQEDVDVIGISILSGAHLVLIPGIIELLRGQNANDILVLVGGVIPPKDIPRLKDAGVDEIFIPGSDTDDIVNYIREEVPKKRKR
jgi:methylmalonyl-CoA mutase C-terminal domain/subunit